MRLGQMIEHCRRQQELVIDPNPPVVFRLAGKVGKHTTRRLFRCKLGCGIINPVGRIVAQEAGGTLLVEFRAQEVLDACHALIGQAGSDHGD